LSSSSSVARRGSPPAGATQPPQNNSRRRRRQALPWPSGSFARRAGPASAELCTGGSLSWRGGAEIPHELQQHPKCSHACVGGVRRLLLDARHMTHSESQASPTGDADAPKGCPKPPCVAEATLDHCIRRPG